MMDDNDLVTKADLDATVERVREMIRDSQTEILDSVQEMVRDAQTEVLKAFLSFGHSNDTRLRTMESTDAGLTARMAEAEKRLTEIEVRLQMNPPAA